MILVWGSTLIISLTTVKNNASSSFLFKGCFASKQFLENKEPMVHHENTIHVDKCLKFKFVWGDKMTLFDTK